MGFFSSANETNSQGQQQGYFGSLLNDLASFGNMAAQGAVYPLQTIYKGLVPVNARQYLKAMTGDTSGVAPEDLWPSDQQALSQVIKAASARKASPGFNEVDNTPKEGSFDYRDWKPSVQAFGFGGADKPAAHTLLDLIKASYSDPQFRMATTVGSAPYKQNADGSYTITDSYDFNSGTRQAYEKMGGLPALIDVAPKTQTDIWLEALANYLIGDRKHNNFAAQPYQLTVGKP